MPEGFDILIDGVQRTFRDRRETAHEAAIYAKQKNPGSVVEMPTL
jgi:hypothetical protein